MGVRKRRNFCLIISTAALVYSLTWLLLTLSNEQIRRLTSTVDSFKNRSAQIHDFVLSSNRSTDTDFTVALPENRTVNKTGRYVTITMCPDTNTGELRTGNQLFQLAAMLHTARLTGRLVAMVRSSSWLDRWFHVRVTRVDNIDTELCPCHTVNEVGFTHYSPVLYKRSDIVGKSILLCGYFQSWKYTVGVESALRHHLRLLPHVSAAIHKYLDQVRPPSWNNFSRIGIHVRAGDIANEFSWQAGFTIPQRPYFEQAMKRFVSQGQRGRIQFIVLSDSMEWVKTAINFTSIVYQLNQISSTKNIDLVHSEGHDAGFDLGLLSLCDGVIMSTGTYGWWGAWLANKPTIYYSRWPRAGSRVARNFDRNDFFPPNWTSIDGPAFSF